MERMRVSHRQRVPHDETLDDTLTLPEPLCYKRRSTVIVYETHFL